MNGQGGGGSRGRELHSLLFSGLAPYWDYSLLGNWDMEPCALTHHQQSPPWHWDQTLSHPLMGLCGLPLDLDILQEVNEDSRPGPRLIHGGPTAPSPRDGNFGSPRALEVPSIWPKTVAIGEYGVKNTPDASPHTAISSPGLCDSMSSCAASPVVPNTPTTVQLPKAVAQKRSTTTKQKKERRSTGASRLTSIYQCSYDGCEGKTFTSRSAMVRHENENHLAAEGTPYFCSDGRCPRSQKGFARRHNLMVHMEGKKHRRNGFGWEHYLSQEQRQGAAGPPQPESGHDGSGGKRGGCY
ncbi:hypothetical protein C7212DRAFT_341901 [Tuber magnatum]|uniref:C2H2-type domain-containing protein n=1 Tax=Tuber magnatum TaxID=42249 RepID=A0A317T1K3_9PEZI|nr:hypothetical protein C7212DRAFT_348969 [Tuber magnatum]PWW79637.1 hypothetical protein C7212DRAFT_341901 [Tuber magnatum]